MLYQHVLCTIVPQWIRYTDPHADALYDHLNQCATQSAECHDQRGCCKKPPFFAGQMVFVLNDTRNLWLPATIICKASNGSYLVKIIGGGQHRHAHDHICKCHSDAVKPDASNIGDVAPAASTSASATQTETANSCCTWNTNTSCTSCYTANSMQSSACCMFATMNTAAIHWSSSKPDWHSPCCPMPNNLKQEVTIQAFLKRCRPRLSLIDEPDDTMTQITPSTTAEVLYH